MSLNSIVSNFSNYEWWFNNIVSGIIPAIFMLSFSKIWKYFRFSLKTLSRRQQLRKLTKIKSLRQDDLLIAIEMQKNSAFFIVFMMLAAFSTAALISNPIKEISGLFWIFILMIMSPTIIAEIYWLNQDSFVKEIMRHREKLRRKTNVTIKT